MQHLWTPWRLAYVSGEERLEGCLFCRAGAGDSGPGELVLHRGELCYVIINKYPYNNGHLMVAPGRHVADLGECTTEELAELMSLARSCERILREAYGPQGFNYGMNLGAAAGAGVVDHLHLHVVPRWTGDANFLTATNETRVVPEDPASTLARLRPAFDAL